MAGQARCLQLPARQRLRAAAIELHRHDAGSTACLPSRASPMGSSSPLGTEPWLIRTPSPPLPRRDPEARSNHANSHAEVLAELHSPKAGGAGPRSRRGSSKACRCRAPLHQAGLQEPLHPRIPMADHPERATKVCPVCGRPFQWRKKWKDVWEEVRYCSERCRRRRSNVPGPLGVE
jgi:hypothetical protein